MNDEAFKAWLGAISQMTAAQRSVTFRMLAEAGAELAPASSPSTSGVGSLADTMETAGFRSTRGGAEPPWLIASLSGSGALASAALARIERDGCPHCASRRLQRWGSSAGLPRYRCIECRRSFNALTGTSLAGLRKKDRWADHAQAMIDGDTLAEAATRCGVAASTAFRWRHRFLAAPALDKPTRLTGIVEADETFVLESFKGKRSDLPRPSRKRGGKAKKRGLSKEQIPVLVARDRSGVTIDAVLPKLDRASVASVLEGVVTPDNQLCCDGGKAIVGFARKGQIPCCILPSPGGPMREAPQLHINNVNGYHGRLKEWLRPFHGVATKYLSNYLGWRRTIEAMGVGAEQSVWLHAAVGINVCQQITI